MASWNNTKISEQGVVLPGCDICESGAGMYRAGSQTSAGDNGTCWIMLSSPRGLDELVQQVMKNSQSGKPSDSGTKCRCQGEEGWGYANRSRKLSKMKHVFFSLLVSL